MKAKQVKDIFKIVFKDADLVCADEDQRRAYFQGARHIVHAMFMSGVIDRENMDILYDTANEEVQKIFVAKINQS